MITLEAPRFSTQFLRDLASRQWLLGLARHLEKAISKDRGHETFDGKGVVFSDYDEERYMGPLSLCKFRFNVTVQMRGNDASREQDTYKACVEYCPDTDTFRTVSEIIDTNETRNIEREALVERKASIASSVCRLRKNFEDREAIYVERGALRVRVFNIHACADAQSVGAKVEEIPTVGLGVGSFPSRDFQLRTPESARRGNIWRNLRRLVSRHPSVLSWDIGAGSEMMTFSDTTWAMGYGGWSLYFDQEIVQGIVSLAADRWSTLPRVERTGRRSKRFPEMEIVQSESISRYRELLEWIDQKRTE